MNRSRKVAKEAAVSFSGMGFGQLVRYLFTVLLGRWVGVEYLGLYSLGNAVTRILETLGCAGLTTGVVRFAGASLGAGDEDGARNAIASTLKMGIFLGLSVMILQLILSRWLVVHFFAADGLLRWILVFNAVSLPFMIFLALAGGASQAYKLMKYKIAAQEMVLPAVLLVTMALAVHWIGPEAGVVLPPLLAAILAATLILFWLFRLTGIRPRTLLRAPVDAGILRYSLPLLFTSLITIVMHWTDVIMLGYFLDDTDVGLYHPAARTSGLLRVVLVSFINIFAPVMAELHAREDRAEMSRLFKLVSRWVITLTLPMSILIVSFPQEVMLLFGPAFVPAAPVLVLLTLATLLQSFLGTGGPMQTMTGHPRWHLLNTALALLLNITLNLVLIPRLGILGAAWATLVALTFAEIMRLLQIWFLLRLHPFSLTLLKPLIAAGVTSVVILALKEYLAGTQTLVALSAAGLGSLLVTFLVLFALGFDADDRQVLNLLRGGD